MNQKATIIVSGAVCIASVATLFATGSPVAFGVGEATPPVVGTGIVSLLTALASGATAIWKLFQSTGPNSILDAVELLRPVLTGKTSLPEGAVRVALTILEADAVRRGNPKDYDDVKSLSRQFLFPTKIGD